MRPQWPDPLVRAPLHHPVGAALDHSEATLPSHLIQQVPQNMFQLAHEHRVTYVYQINQPQSLLKGLSRSPHTRHVGMDTINTAMTTLIPFPIHHATLMMVERLNVAGLVHNLETGGVRLQDPATEVLIESGLGLAHETGTKIEIGTGAQHLPLAYETFVTTLGTKGRVAMHHQLVVQKIIADRLFQLKEIATESASDRLRLQ